MKTSPFIKVAVLEDIIEAQLIVSILVEKKIPHRVRSFHDTAYDGLFQVQKGWGEIHAPQACESGIMEIIDDIRTQNGLGE